MHSGTPDAKLSVALYSWFLLEDVLDARLENRGEAVEAGPVEVGKAARHSQFHSAIHEPVHIEKTFIHQPAVDRFVVQIEA